MALALILTCLLLAALVGESWLMWQMLRQQGRLLLRLEAVEVKEAGAPLAPQPGDAVPAGLEVGTPAPLFSLADVQGETLTLADLLAHGKPVVLLFADPGCEPCAALSPEVGSFQRDNAEKLTLAVISRGSQEANQSKVSVHGITRVLLQKDREVAEAYRASGTPGTPSLVLIRPDGIVGSRLALGEAEVLRGLNALRSLVPTGATSDQQNGSGLQEMPGAPAPGIGEPAPDFSLPDLEGNLITLSDFRGRSTLVLFWRPSCDFCQRMLPEIKAWEARRPEGAPTLVVVSSESVADNRAMGLRSPVVLDHTAMSVGCQFGAVGTPMAMLVDEEGKIASRLTVGAPAILALARSLQESTPVGV
ncbi:MAG TPA: redoxin domain-containing protein [Ktedonobacteraceae bacterium]|nr:redoxin domain-containing protein [Ktedonobacteraceae bacterium]